MIQTVLMFLAPAQSPPAFPGAASVTNSSAMATRLHSRAIHGWRKSASIVLSVAGNALGLILFLAGLALVLRLAEVLLS